MMLIFSCQVMQVGEMYIYIILEGNTFQSCYFTHQVRHLHQIILPQFQRDFISLLPKELALYVLSFLPPKDLLRAAQTCKYWNILAADNLLWREKCHEAGIENHLVVMDRRRRKGTSVSHMSPYKVLYEGQRRQERLKSISQCN